MERFAFIGSILQYMPLESPNLLGGQTAQTAVVSHPFHEEFLVHGGLVVRNLPWIHLLFVQKTLDWLNAAL